MAQALDTADDLIEFGDTAKTRSLIYDGMEQAVKSRFPVEDADHRLELTDVRYDGPKEFSLKEQKDALMKGRDLTTPLRGKWRLIHTPSNNVISERDDVVMRVPYYTDRGTFVRRSNEYSVANQARLRPGVYVRKRRTGEIEAHVNVRPGTGRPFRMRMDDKTGVFKAGIGTSETPAYTLLKALGATDDDLIRAWGPDLVVVNAKAAKESDLAKLYERLSPPRKGEEEERDKGAALRKRLEEYALDPDVVQTTLGIRDSKGVDSRLLLRTTEKILNVAKGDEEADDRDHPRFSEILGVESLMRERVDKDAGRLAKNLLWKAKRKKNTDIIRRGALDIYTDSFVNGSGLVSPLDETNPLSTLEQMYRITKLGEGGISSAESVGDEARDVNPGFMGYIDPITGPEGCYPADAEVMTSHGWRRWGDLGEEADLLCVTGGVVSHAKVPVERSEFDGDLVVHGEGSVILRVTPTHKHWCRAPGPTMDGGFRWEPAKATKGADRVFMLAVEVGTDGPLPLDAIGEWDREKGFEARSTSKEDAESLELAAVRSGMSAVVFGMEHTWHTLVSPRYATNPCKASSERYSGDVFCATVPGGLLFVRGREGARGVWTGNMNIGVDVRAAYHTYRGKDGKLYGEFNDARSGKKVFLSAPDAANSVVAFPGQLKSNGDTAYAMVRGKLGSVPKDEVDYEAPSFAHMFSPNTNLNPMPTAVQAGRQFYGAKFWSQYMPLKAGEVPLVDSEAPDGSGKSVSEFYGDMVGSLKSPATGTVVKVTDDAVIVDTADGRKEIGLVKDLPFNRLTSLSYSAIVKPGDPIEAGQPVARSSFTDQGSGALSLGRNLKVAVVPFAGHSVSGNTNILYTRKDGTMSFGPIAEMPSVDCVAQALDSDGWHGVSLPVHGFMAHRAASGLVKTTTKDGSSLVTTRCHSFVTLADDGESLVPITPDKFVLGRTCIPVIPPVLPFPCDSAVVTLSGIKNGRTVKFELDRATGILVGLHLAEGCVIYRDRLPHAVSIAATEPEIIAFVEEWAVMHGINPYTSHTRTARGASGSVILKSAALARWLTACGRYAWGKHIPDFAWTASHDFIEGLVSGYMSGDGTVSDKQCTVTTTSSRLASGFCCLLGALGIRATYRPYNNGVLANRIAFQVHIFREFVSRMPDLLLSRKREAIELLATLPVQFSHDRIPIPARYRGVVSKVRGKQLSEDGYISRGLLNQVRDQLPEQIVKLIDSSVWWDVVSEVEPVPDEPWVYDLDMRPLANFAVEQGIVVHNSYEDALVISEDAAEKLATSRLFGFDAEERDGIKLGKARYSSLFQSKFTKDQLAKVGDDGIVKPGVVVNKGDPLILATGPKLLTASDAALGRLHKALRTAVTDKAQVWEYDHPGVVTDAAFTARGGARVNVKTEPRMEVGDKASSRFGLKGTIGKIIPMDEMPRDAATNEPYDILLNPMTIQSRVAAGQPMEIALGKLAKVKGRILIPQIPPNGEDGEPVSWADWSAKQLEDAGVPDSTDIFDPVLKKTIKNVGDGYMYVLPFHHIAEKKISARGASGGFTADDQPAKGGYHGSKRFSSLDVNAILSHGATEVLRDAITVRGSRNDGFWRAMRTGAPLPEPEVPFVYRKFLATLQAGGVNVTEKGRLTSIRAMTDKDVGALSKGEINSSDALDNDFRPVPGGLFDPGITGGADGKNWAHITLDEPVPNPVMEDPIRRVLGLTVKGLEDVVAGRAELNGKTGGEALRSALASIDTKSEIERLRNVAKTTRGQTRDGAVKALAYLSAAEKQGVSPTDWLITKVPVLPPVFRPISRLGKMALSADMNELYRDVIESRNGLRDVKAAAGDEGAAEERMQVYEAVRAATGLGDAITPEGQARNLKGAIRQVIGTQPKTGMYQSKVLSKTVGNVGRAVITPDPSYDMDEIGIPEDEGWELYKDFVVRRLVRRGIAPERALEMIEKKDPMARKEMIEEAEVRPVLVDRAPTWHKFNMMAFRPRFVSGNSLRLNTLVTKGAAADFDGDQMNFHVPATDKAAKQALEKMLPSKNLIALSDLESPVHAPTMEMTMGLYMLTKDPNDKPVRKFASAAEVIKAYRAGDIGANDPVDIG